MRVLFAVWPLTAHLYPIVPLAWALQSAGHEVRVASHPVLTDSITAAGLTAVSLGSEETMPALSRVGEFLLGEDERERLTRDLEIGPQEQTPWLMFSIYQLASIRIFHSAGPDSPAVPGADDLVSYARDWQPDLVLWDPSWPSAAVAARVCGAAHARVLWGPDYCAWSRDLFARRTGGRADPLAQAIEPVAERYGVEVDDELLLGQWTVDPTPVPVRLPATTRSIALRRIPYTGAGVEPDWLHPRPGRPRVALTLGASGRMFDRNSAVVARMLETVADLDIEVVATFDAAQLEGQQVPANVRTVDYLPLNQLLPTCSAIIHHGGGGTFAAAVAQRVPQLIDVEEGLDSMDYAEYVAAHGAGLTLKHKEQSVTEMRKRLMRVLDEPSFQEGASRLHDDWLAMPSPNDIVPVLEKLAASRRA